MIPSYLRDTTLWWSLLPIPAATLIVAALVFVAVVRSKGAPEAARFTLPLAAFLLLGLVAGYLTGLSRESAVGAVVPAVLTLMGGVAAVLIGRAANQAASLRVSGLILLFSFGLLLGTTWGAAMRQAVVDYEASEGEQMRRSHVELRVREFREALGLPPEMPEAKAAEKTPAESKKK